MYIKVIPIETFGDNEIKTVNVEEYDNVRLMKSFIYDAYGVPEIVSGTRYYLVYGNIILNEDKLVNSYNIINNGEVKIGLLENILKDNEVIVEVFLGELISSIMYLFVNRDDNVSRIKSIISELFKEHFSMFDDQRQELDENQIISKMKMDDSYYKIFVNFNMSNVGRTQQTFDDCCESRNQYVIRKFMKLFPCISWRIDNRQDWKDVLLSDIQQFKNYIADSRNIQYDESFVNMPVSFINSRFLFCIDMAERINNLCSADYDNAGLKSSQYGIRDYIFAVLHVALITAINSDQSKRSIIIGGLDIFLDYLNSGQDNWIYLMKLFLDRILIGDLDLDRIKLAFESRMEEPTLIKVKAQGQCHMIDISTRSMNIGHIKKALSEQIREPMEHLYFIHLDRPQQPTNKDNIEEGQLANCLIEIICSMENLEVVQEGGEVKVLGEGGYSRLLLCRRKFRDESLAVKVPRPNENLYNEIATQCRLEETQFLKIYLELVDYEGLVCMAMQYVLESNLITYVETKGGLHPDTIARLSYEILPQIKAVHDKEVIHGDINGKNILFDKECHPILIDFGQAIHPKSFTKEDLIKHLRTHNVATLGYAAPELKKSECSTKIDIWSFGILVAEMLNGKAVIFNYILLCNRKKQVVKLQKPINDSFLEFYHKCLAWNPSDRASAQDLLKSKFIRKFKRDFIV